MKFTAIIFLVFLITSCNSNSDSDNIASTDSSYKTVVPETAFINAEKYVGTLPCADCEGIDISLQLNHDSTYIMNSVYKGSRVDSTANHLKETGTWSMHGSDSLFLSGKDHTIKYLKKDNILTQLDGSGNIITGPLADKFVLHKK